MASEFQIVLKNGVHFLTGPLEERSDLTPLYSAKPPLVLNLKGIGNLSSLGIKRVIDFLAVWGDKPLEYQDCSVSFMTALNMVPGLGESASGKRIKISSLFLPYRCPTCKKTVDIHAQTVELFPAAKKLKAPHPECPSCHKGMRCEDDLEDYLQHLQQAS